MFNFLVFIGFILIIWGVYIDRDNLDSSLLINTNTSNKVDRIDEIIHNYNPILEEEDIVFKDVLDSTTIQEDEDVIAVNTTEAFNVISLYEAGKYTLEQTCKILNMNKGEVLLLKNIYKKYQN